MTFFTIFLHIFIQIFKYPLANGCYKDEITYNSSDEQIKALISVSSTCSQSISNNCTSNPLTGSSYWIDNNGDMRTYWHGDGVMAQSGCYCSIEGDGCLENPFGISRECNCDSLNSFVLDAGILRNKLETELSLVFLVIISSDF